MLDMTRGKSVAEEKLVEGQDPGILDRASQIAHAVRCLRIPDPEEVHPGIQAHGDDLRQGKRLEAVLHEIQAIHVVLGKAPGVFHAAMGLDQGRIQGHDTGIVVFHAVHRPGPQAQDEAQHARPGIHALVPDKGVVRETHAGYIGEEVVFPVGA
jgi:hypothetical protein